MTSLTAPKFAAVTHGTVTPELLHLHRFACTDAIRHNLTFVMVRRRSSGWQAVATDGHRMAMVDLPADSIFSDVSQFYIPATMLAKVKLKKSETALFDIHDDTVRIVCLSGVTLTETVEQADIQYPDVDLILPATSQTHAAMWGVNHDYVWEAGDYVRKVTGQKQVGIAIHAPAEELSPMRVTSSALPGYVCIIMPMRL